MVTSRDLLRTAAVTPEGQRAINELALVMRATVNVYHRLIERLRSYGNNHKFDRDAF
jgi:hypothetical protein